MTDKSSSEDPTTNALVAQNNQIEQALDEKIKKKLESEEQSQAAASAANPAEAQIEDLLKDGTSVSDLQRQMQVNGASSSNAISSLLEQAVA